MCVRVSISWSPCKKGLDESFVHVGVNRGGRSEHLPSDGREEKNKGDGKEFLEESESMEN